MAWLKKLKFFYRCFSVNFKFICNKGIYEELHYLSEFLKNNEDRLIEDYDEFRTSLSELRFDTHNYFSDVWSSFKTENKNLKKEISILKRRITRQTNEQNDERKAFLKLIGKSEKDFFKVLKND